MPRVPEVPLRGQEWPDLQIWMPLAGVLQTGSIIVDVRSPVEFEEDHLPGSSNVPLFTDQERSVVGTLFRHLGPEEARNWGEERVTAELDNLTRDLLAALRLDEDPPFDGLRVVCCSRGGERSEAVVKYLRSIGYPVVMLEGGYRSYRKGVRETLQRFQPQRLVVLDGLTGCGKTRVLRQVARICPRQVIDLEGAAGHRSSLLGDIGLEPVSQKRFEGRLADSSRSLDGDARWILVEGESRRVGDREIPAPLWQAMENAPRIELIATREERVRLLCQEYLAADGVEPLRQRLPALAGFDGIGEEGVKTLDALLATGDVEEAARILLEKHYDPRYRHGNQERVFADTIPMEDSVDTARGLVALLDGGVGTQEG
ncbi:MAG TPA: tRNA 2-selenouridine(34) synthase MnmH [Planctomycetes bacterium]|nr:tRNA 2-selenouridine(34) synthase MnmH [Planctomycetota bacterium]